ncbi:unnamed protein product [Prunus brigantina]
MPTHGTHGSQLHNLLLAISFLVLYVIQCTYHLNNIPTTNKVPIIYLNNVPIFPLQIMYAVVTGSNQGIGFGTVRKLASNGIMVVLTALDDKMGLEAIEKLKECGLSNLVVFHQLDVTNTASIASLADFVKTQFGKLDILVNNEWNRRGP